MRGAMPNQQAVILLMGTVAQNVDIYKYRKTQVFRLIPNPHYWLEKDRKKSDLFTTFINLAERGGFEPPVQ